MAAPIGPGDWLLCIRAGHSADRSVELVKDRVYCVDFIDHAATGACDTCGDTSPGLQLVGLGAAGGAWCHCAFKPLGGNSKALKAPPVRLSEDA